MPEPSESSANPSSDNSEETNSSRTSQSSFWKNLGQGFLDSAVAAGKTIKYVYEKGDENKHFVLPAINGIVGHRLAEFHDPSAIKMRFRIDGKDVEISEAADQIGNKSTLVIFVHGLMSDEVPWQMAMQGGTGYGPILAQESDVHCLYVRYNTGLHISENGQQLDRLLSELLKGNGGTVRRLILVGHSMGGLVVRSAGYYGKKARSKWQRILSDVVLLGVPNDGSFLERFGHIATFVLKNIWNYPTRIVGRIADERSDGIKDLRWGFMAEDWKDEDADKLMNVKRTEVPPLAGVRYHVLLASVSESVISPLSMYFGDGLVGTRSAAGKEFVEFTAKAAAENPSFLSRLFKRSKAPQIEYRAFMVTGHLGLLGSQDVCDYLREAVNRK